MPVYRLTDALLFPRPEAAEPNGLLAIGGDLSKERLLLAYAMGIFPWYNEGDPVLWHSPMERLVLYVDDVRVNRTLRKTLRKRPYRLTLDTAFDQVIALCASTPRADQGGTWITEDMRRAYKELHAFGYAHSVEAWRGDELVGGLYGVSLGRAFFGESMFSLAPNASKIALVTLCAQLRHWDFDFVDCQIWTPTLESLGAIEEPKAKFLQILDRAVLAPTRKGNWSLSETDEPDPLSASRSKSAHFQGDAHELSHP